MNELQVWTLVGAVVALVGMFGTLMFATFALNRSMLRSALDAFAARLDVRFAAIDARFDAAGTRFDARFAAIDARFAAIDARLDAVDARFDGLDSKIDNLANVTDVRLSSLEGDMHLVKAYLLGQRSA